MRVQAGGAVDAAKPIKEGLDEQQLAALLAATQAEEVRVSMYCKCTADMQKHCSCCGADWCCVGCTSRLCVVANVCASTLAIALAIALAQALGAQQ
jgi:hypothetical protein